MKLSVGMRNAKVILMKDKAELNLNFSLDTWLYRGVSENGIGLCLNTPMVRGLGKDKLTIEDIERISNKFDRLVGKSVKKDCEVTNEKCG